MTDLSALADAIDPRRYGHGDKERMTVPCDELIAASDALRSASLTHAAGFAAGITAAAKVCEAEIPSYEDMCDSGVVIALKVCASAIRSLLAPQSPDAGMVASAMEAMRAELKSRDCLLKNVDGIWLSDVVAGDLQRLARAALTAISSSTGGQNG